MITELKPISEIQEIDEAALQNVRWIGSDGTHRGGKIVMTFLGSQAIKARDKLRGTLVTLHEGEWEYDRPKDDAGNPK